MRLFGSGYRYLPRFLLRRANRLVGEFNAFLAVVAIGLAMLDLLLLMQQFVDSLPPAILQMSAQAP